jgi:hypothetical protein
MEDKEAYIQKGVLGAINKEALHTLCKDFDILHGDYPEHEYEGDAVYQFFLKMVQIKEVTNTKGVTALRELGFSSIEIDQFLHVEKIRRSAERKTRKREEAMKIIRNMSL